MKCYNFKVSLGGYWCDGSINIKAKNEIDAYQKAIKYVGDRLFKAFPTLNVNFDIEIIEEKTGE